MREVGEDISGGRDESPDAVRGRMYTHYDCNENEMREASYTEPGSVGTGVKLGSGLPSHLVLLGVNHRTCPLPVRERLRERFTLDRLKGSGGSPPWDDVVLLSTCNRVEAYALDHDPSRTLEVLRNAFGPEAILGAYELEDEEAAAHLFRVAAGLDSVALGETQVADQVRRAPSDRPDASRAETLLTALFEQASRIAPQIRAAAGVDDPRASASHAAVRFITQIVPVPHPHVALIGSGKMARLAAEALRGRATITVLHRDRSEAERVAASLGGIGRGLDELPEALATADAVIAATASPRPLIGPALLREVLAARPGRPLWIVDLGVPRNIEAGGEVPAGATLIDVDGLGPWAAPPPNPMALARAEARIRAAAQAFLASLRPEEEAIVAAIRRWADVLRTKEIEEALVRLPNASETERTVLDRLAHRLVNAILHGPTRHLRTLQGEERRRVAAHLLDSWRDLGGEKP
jgi:glutamyl-tRNA reductase